MSTKPEKHKWDGDISLSSIKDDKLQRASFAERVAKELSSWTKKDHSLVISLNGEWGSGKTTLKNFVVESLQPFQKSASNKKRPIVVEFNPWRWSGQQKIFEAFFDEIGAGFKDPELDQKRAKELARFWEGFKQLTLATDAIAQRLQESVTALTAILAGSSGLLASQTTDSFWKSFFSYSGIALLFIAGVCSAWSPFASALSKLFNWNSQKTKRSLETIRNDLKSALEKLEAPIIVIVDDIDRLTKKEIRYLVQLIKANANFPNILYLLLYQKQVVATALDGFTGDSGQSFLKKIVQIELEVPTAPDSKMRVLFDEGIKRIWSKAKLPFPWEVKHRERWRNVFTDAVWPFFKTPRDIKRFLSVYEFYFDGHIDGGILEVNPVDLVMLETLRLFDSQAYEEIEQAFTKERLPFIEVLYASKGIHQEFKIRVDNLLNRKNLTDRHKKALRALIQYLFPQAIEHSNSDKEGWNYEYRICHPRHFPKYFQLNAEPDDVPAKLIAKFFDGSTDRGVAVSLFQEAFQKGLFRRLTESLSSIKDDLPESQIEPIVGAIFDISDTLPDVEGRMFIGDTERDLARLAISIVTRLPNNDTREAVLLRTSSSSAGITGPSVAISMLAPHDDEIVENRAVTTESYHRLRDHILPRLWAFAKSPNFFDLRLAGYLIYRLRDWSSIGEVREWLEQAVKEKGIPIKFLMRMLTESHSSGGGGSKLVIYLPALELEKFVDLTDLSHTTAQEAKTPFEQDAVKALEKALALKAVGKPYNRIPVRAYDEEGSVIPLTKDMENI